MSEIGYARLSEQFFKILPCIPSGPLALLDTLTTPNTCSTPTRKSFTIGSLLASTPTGAAPSPGSRILRYMAIHPSTVDPTPPCTPGATVDATMPSDLSAAIGLNFKVTKTSKKKKQVEIESTGEIYQFTGLLTKSVKMRCRNFQRSTCGAILKVSHNYDEKVQYGTIRHSSACEFYQ